VQHRAYVVTGRYILEVPCYLLANLEKELSTGGCANVNTLFGEKSRAGGGCRESDINLAQNMRMGADTSSGCALLRSVACFLLRQLPSVQLWSWGHN
jgi:hypothetical protein